MSATFQMPASAAAPRVRPRMTLIIQLSGECLLRGTEGRISNPQVGQPQGAQRQAAPIKGQAAEFRVASPLPLRHFTETSCESPATSRQDNPEDVRRPCSPVPTSTIMALNEDAAATHPALWLATWIFTFVCFGLTPLVNGALYWGECAAAWYLQPCFPLAVGGCCVVLVHFGISCSIKSGEVKTSAEANMKAQTILVRVSLPALVFLGYLLATLVFGECAHNQVTWVCALILLILPFALLFCVCGVACLYACLMAARRLEYTPV